MRNFLPAWTPPTFSQFPRLIASVFQEAAPKSYKHSFQTVLASALKGLRIVLKAALSIARACFIVMASFAIITVVITPRTALTALALVHTDSSDLNFMSTLASFYSSTSAVLPSSGVSTFGNPAVRRAEFDDLRTVTDINRMRAAIVGMKQNSLIQSLQEHDKKVDRKFSLPCKASESHEYHD